MQTRFRVFLALVWAAPLFLSLGTSPAQEKKGAPAVVTSPKKGEEVEQTNQVVGKLAKKESWPVILVRASNDTEWWVQPPIDEVKDGKFAGSAHSGREGMDQGDKYSIIILVCPNKETAQDKFKDGDRIKSLPPSSRYARSEQVEVVRK